MRIWLSIEKLTHKFVMISIHVLSPGPLTYNIEIKFLSIQTVQWTVHLWVSGICFFSSSSFTNSHCTFSNNKASNCVCISFYSTSGTITMSYYLQFFNSLHCYTDIPDRTINQTPIKSLANTFSRTNQATLRITPERTIDQTIRFTPRNTLQSVLFLTQWEKPQK